jgi:hypothetical protein
LILGIPAYRNGRDDPRTEIIREGESNFVLLTPVGPTKRNEPVGRCGMRMSQVQFSSLEHRADTRKNVVLSLDVGFKVMLQMTELTEIF